MTDRWYVRLLLATALMGFGGRAQNPGDPSRPFDLKGTVYDSVTNAPIAHALVQIPGQPYPAAFTDGDGRFEIPQVRPGLTLVQAEKPGYFSPRDLSQGRGGFVMLSESTGDVQVKLIPEGHIEGRITNSDKEPVAGLTISAMGEQIVAGWKRQMPIGSATTNAAGRFRLDGLRPGQYYLRTAERRMFPSAPLNSGVNIGYAPQYYPVAPDANWSQAMEVKAGETVQANMELPPARFYQIDGAVTGFSGQGAYIELTNEAGQVAENGIDPKTGTFKLFMVFPGNWKLASRTQGPRSSSAYGEQYVHVTDSNVSGVRIDMHPVPNVPLQIDMPTSGPPAGNNIGTPQVQLIAMDHSESQQMFWSQTDNSKQEPSRFFAGIPPGSYHVSVQPMAGMCVQSISSGSRDLAGGVFVVPEDIAPQPIHVVFGTDCAKLTGDISTTDANWTGMAVLVPVSAPTSPILLNILPDRSFALQGLSPGDYRIFAVSDLAGLEYANPQAMQNIPSEEIHLDANQTTHVSLELYRREQP